MAGRISQEILPAIFSQQPTLLTALVRAAGMFLARFPARETAEAGLQALSKIRAKRMILLSDL